MNSAKRQRIRLGILTSSFLLFPATIFYFSPYLSVMGAFEGVIAGCLMVFGLQLLSGLVLRRGFCGWICPAGGLQEIERQFAGDPFRLRRLNLLKYLIWVPWVCSIVAGAIVAGGFSSVDLLYHIDHGVSVTSIQAFAIYMAIVALFFVPNIFLGRRGMCHCICWMAPFMVIGEKAGKMLGVPQLHVKANAKQCVACGACERACPMSLQANEIVINGYVENSECIQCGACCDACRKGALKLTFGNR